MRHERALELVSMHCPGEQAGWLWETDQRSGCDTIWAVADQYDDEEEEDAIKDLRELAEGRVPDGWTQFCERCDSQGEVLCAVCGGTGGATRVCQHCKGDGVHDCPDCTN